MHRHTLTWVVMFGLIALMFLQIPPMAARQDSVFNTYSALVEVDALARQQYVDALGDDLLVEGAIRGMMRQLDPYSGYISPAELPAFERRSHGEFVGVGAEIGMRGGQLTVIAPVEGSPAAHGGVLAGDRLLAIEGQDLEDRSVFDVEEMLVGRPGTSVRLTIQHVGQDEPCEITILRGPVSLRSVHGFRRDAAGRWDYLIDPQARIGYIRVSNFRDNTLRDFDLALRELNAREPRALILDLRFNPGGLMHQAVAMVDRFLDGGLIVSTVTRRKAIDAFNATPQGTDMKVPLFVLINGSSASSAEIVAGALQARGRAVLVGERSFGKGSVQHLIHLLGQKAAIKLTVAYYRLPNGRIIHRTEQNARTDAWGVRPDVEVRLDPDAVRKIQESRQAVDLAFAGAPSSQAVPPPPGDSSAVSATPREVILDRQLMKALSLARGAPQADR